MTTTATVGTTEAVAMVAGTAGLTVTGTPVGTGSRRGFLATVAVAADRVVHTSST